MLKNVTRVIAAAAVVAGAAWGLWVFCVLPFRCNRQEQRAEDTTFWAIARADPTEAGIAARRTAERMPACIAIEPTHANLYMIAAANAQILLRPADAVVLYERALRYDRRPELYLQLGLAQLEAGQRQRAIESLTVSNLYFPDKLEQIPAPDVREAVDAATKAFFSAGKHAVLPPLLRSGPSSK